MIEGLDQSTVLVLSALAVLFGVPLAMLLWIAAQSIQMRALRRRLGQVESALGRLQEQGAPAAEVPVESPTGMGAGATTRALDPTASKADAPASAVAVPLESSSAEVDANATRQVVQAELQPEPTQREIERSTASDGRDWLGVSDLPGPPGGKATPAPSEGSSQSSSEASEAPEASGDTATAETQDGTGAATDAAAAEDDAAAATGPDSPARQWLRQAAAGAAPGAADESATPSGDPVSGAPDDEDPRADDPASEGGPA